MPTTITGDRDNITSDIGRAVLTTSGNGVTPISVQTTAPHLFGNNDWVLLTGVGGNTAANGYFKATVTGADTFTIAATGNGAYTAGGAVIDLSLTPQFQIPSGGDPPTAASVAAAFQALADRTQFLMGAPTSTYVGVNATYVGSYQVPPISNWNDTIEALANNAAYFKARQGAQFVVGTDSNDGSGLAINLANGSPTPIQADLLTSAYTARAGDIIEGSFSSTVAMHTAGAHINAQTWRVRVSEDGGSTYLEMPHAQVDVSASIASDFLLPIAITFRHVFVAAGPIAYRLGLIGDLTISSAGDTAQCNSPWTCVSRLLRAT